MKKIIVLLCALVGLGAASFGQQVLAYRLYNNLEQSGTEAPRVGAKTDYFEVYLDARGRVSELHRAPGNDSVAIKPVFTANYSDRACSFGFSNLLDDPVEVTLKWNSEQEGLYDFNLHSEETIDAKSGKKFVKDARIKLYFGTREAFWGIFDNHQNTEMDRWRYKDIVQTMGAVMVNGNLGLGLDILDGRGISEPDTATAKSEYKRIGKDIIGYSYYRYNWIGTSDAEGWMRDNVWKFTDVRAQRLESPDVFTAVLNYLILDEYFHLGTMQYFGHALFDIALK